MVVEQSINKRNLKIDFGTVVTLLLIPCNYMILQDIYGLFRRHRPTVDAPDDPPEPTAA